MRNTRRFVVIQKQESVEEQLEMILQQYDSVEVMRPNRYDDIIEALQGAHCLIIDPMGRGMNAARIIATAMRLGVHVVQCVPDEDPTTERAITEKKRAA